MEYIISNKTSNKNTTKLPKLIKASPHTITEGINA